MVLVLMNYAYLTVSLALLLCMFPVARRYMESKNNVMLLFIAFLLIFVISGVLGFAHGLFDIGSTEAAIIQKSGLVLGIAASAQFTLFLLFPLREQFEGSIVKPFLLLVPILFYLFAGISFAVLMANLASSTPFWVILGLLATAFFNMIILAIVVIREQEPTYKRRVSILLIGYVIFVLASFVRSEEIAIPLLMIIGILIMTVGILKR